MKNILKAMLIVWLLLIIPAYVLIPSALPDVLIMAICTGIAYFL